MARLGDFFSGPAELLDLEPEELAGVLLEIIHSNSETKNGIFGVGRLDDDVYPQYGGGPWDHIQQTAVEYAIVEAINWLRAQNLVMADPKQSGDYWLTLTRRGRTLETRIDVEAYRNAGILPTGLLQPELANKVRSLFLRGDHDTAVFQAFKEVEVAARRGCGYSDDVIGKALMQKAFAVNDGPLRDPDLVPAEREAEFFLFAGAIGHAKNPASHRDVSLSREEAARLIVFASYLLAIVEERVAAKTQCNSEVA